MTDEPDAIRIVPSDGVTPREVVDMLEDIITRAAKGEVLGFVMCAELTGREVLTVDAGDFQPFSMIGHLEFAKCRVMERRLEKPPAYEDGDDE